MTSIEIEKIYNPQLKESDILKIIYDTFKAEGIGNNSYGVHMYVR